MSYLEFAKYCLILSMLTYVTGFVWRAIRQKYYMITSIDESIVYGVCTHGNLESCLSKYPNSKSVRVSRYKFWLILCYIRNQNNKTNDTLSK
jgi:hypothetical protein